jgi:hypothetical protein
MQLLASFEHADAATSSSGDSFAVTSPLIRLRLLRAAAFNLSYSGNYPCTTSVGTGSSAQQICMHALASVSNTKSCGTVYSSNGRASTLIAVEDGISCHCTLLSQCSRFTCVSVLGSSNHGTQASTHVPANNFLHALYIEQRCDDSW